MTVRREVLEKLAADVGGFHTGAKLGGNGAHQGQKKLLTVFEFNMLAHVAAAYTGASSGGVRKSFRMADTEKPRACK